MTVSRSCCKGRAGSLKPGRKAGGVEGAVLVTSLTGLATKLKGEERGRNRKETLRTDCAPSIVL